MKRPIQRLLYSNNALVGACSGRKGMLARRPRGVHPSAVVVVEA